MLGKERRYVSFSFCVCHWLSWIQVMADVHRSFTATDEEMECYKQVPFYKCCLCFHDFDDVERQHMEEIAASNGLLLSSSYWIV